MKSSRSAIALLALLAAPALFAKDVYIAVGGSVGVFRSDARIFNPSASKDIVIQARFLPAGTDTGHPDNSGVSAKSITIPKRQMVVYDDVVASLFSATGLGSIRLTSDDDFIATQRVYAGVSNSATSTPCTAAVNPCTLGQFVPGLDVTAAKKKGVMIQLKSGTSFRTNFGFVNPGATAASVKLALYDKSNAAVGSVKTMTIKPFGVITPSSVPAYFGSPSNDLSDSWMAFESDQPVMGYASVVDNGSTDQTFIAAAEDTGTGTLSNPPAPAKSVDVSLRSFSIDFTTDPGTLKVGDEVTMNVRGAQSGHGFMLIAPNGTTLVPDRGDYAAGETNTFTFKVPVVGTYTYFCTQGGCGAGHSDMGGVFVVSN